MAKVEELQSKSVFASRLAMFQKSAQSDNRTLKSFNPNRAIESKKKVEMTSTKAVEYKPVIEVVKHETKAEAKENIKEIKNNQLKTNMIDADPISIRQLESKPIEPRVAESTSIHNKAPESIPIKAPISKGIDNALVESANQNPPAVVSTNKFSNLMNIFNKPPPESTTKLRPKPMEINPKPNITSTSTTPNVIKQSNNETITPIKAAIQEPKKEMFTEEKKVEARKEEVKLVVIKEEPKTTIVKEEVKKTDLEKAKDNKPLEEVTKKVETNMNLIQTSMEPSKPNKINSLLSKFENNVQKPSQQPIKPLINTKPIEAKSIEIKPIEAMPIKIKPTENVNENKEKILIDNTLGINNQKREVIKEEIKPIENVAIKEETKTKKITPPQTIKTIEPIGNPIQETKNTPGLNKMNALLSKFENSAQKPLPQPIKPPIKVTNEAKPIETKPIETKPIVTKPIEIKPIEAKPIDTKPILTQPIDTKPISAKPIDSKPIETKPILSFKEANDNPYKKLASQNNPSNPKPLNFSLPSSNKPTTTTTTFPIKEEKSNFKAQLESQMRFGSLKMPNQMKRPSPMEPNTRIKEEPQEQTKAQIQEASEVDLRNEKPIIRKQNRSVYIKHRFNNQLNK